MSTEEIRTKVKRSIAKITNISFDEISDNAAYKEDLQLDSLTILEIAVDAEYQFQVKLSDDDLGVLRTVDDTVRMVQQYLSPVMAACPWVQESSFPGSEWALRSALVAR